MVDDSGYDPPHVSWQTDALYHVEHARRMLKESRQRLEAALAWHRRYEDEARQRAIALKLAQEERKAYLASPEGKAEEARREAERVEERQRGHVEDMARRRYRLPVWAEWAAWQWSVENKRQYVIGAELGGIARSVVGRAIEDYLYLSLPEVDVSWHGYCPLYYGHRPARLRRHFKGRVEPAAPGRLVENDDPLVVGEHNAAYYRARDAWIYRQRVAGQSYEAIAARAGMTHQRVRQICWKWAEIDRKRQTDWSKPKPWRASTNRGRPLDMGGPRDIWLTYQPSPDPRLDNMESVRA